MINSAEYKAKVQSNKVTAQEQAALPQAMRNLKKIYDPFLALIQLAIRFEEIATQSSANQQVTADTQARDSRSAQGKARLAVTYRG
jgi:hypothetical protein